MTLINFKQEATLLTSFISSFWEGTEGDWFADFIAEVFKKGVMDSRYIASQYINFEAGKLIGESFSDLIDARRQLVADGTEFECGYDFDALCIIHKFVDSVGADVFNTAWTNASSTTIDKFAEKMQAKYNFGVDALKPSKEVSSIKVRGLVRDYKGYKGSHVRTQNVLNKLTPEQATSVANSIQIEMYKWLVNSVYQHGASCAMHNNTTDILSVIVPFYKNNLKAPLMVGNGDKLLKELEKSAYFKFMCEIGDINFRTQNELDAEVKAEAEAIERIKNETPEERAIRLKEHNDWFNGMMERVVNDGEDSVSKKVNETLALIAKSKSILPVGVETF